MDAERRQRVEALLDTDNWFDYAPFYAWMAANPGYRRFVEVGVWKGHSISFLAGQLRHREGVEIYAVDLFESSKAFEGKKRLRDQLPYIQQVYEANLERTNTRELITDMVARSDRAAEQFADGSLDVVFIDASHNYESVKRDIRAWRPKVRPGGILAGHDYSNPDWPGVKRAVDNCLSDVPVRSWGSCWYAEIPLVEATGITILVACHDLGELINDCVDSLVLQTDPHWRCVIVDDASNDATARMLQSHPIIQRDDRFRLLTNAENRGYIETLRQLIEAAETDIVGILDGDDALAPDAVSEVLAAYRRVDSGFIYSNFHVCDALLRPLGVGFCRELRSGQTIVEMNCASHFKTFRRSAYYQTDGFDHDILYAEDKDLVYKLEEVTKPYFVDKPLYNYRTGRGEAQSSGERGETGRRNMQRAIENARSRRSRRSFPGFDFSENGGTNRLPAVPVGAIHLSLCMIVRNNESTLVPCLASIRPWVDELIVVDTGSTDRTPDIAARHGAQVYRFPWCDDFAAARNESLRHAHGKWLFWMDSDDTVDPANGSKLREFGRARHRDKTLGFVMQVHCPGDDANDITVVDHVKMFRNLPELRFEGRIHEQVLPAIRRLGGEVEFTDIFVVHSGADRTAAGRQRKLQRDLHILRLDLRDRPDHPFVLFNLGMTLADAGEHAQAVDALSRSLLVSPPQDSHVRKTYALAIASLMQLGHHAGAEEACLKGLALFPKDPEILFRQGMLAHQRGKLDQAERAYLAVLADRDGRHFASKDRAIVGFKARHNLAMVYMDMEQTNRAEQQWRLVVQESPGFAPAWRGLASTAMRMNDPNLLDRLAAEMGESDRLAVERKVIVATAHVQRGELSQARALLYEAAAIPTSDHYSLRQLCQFLFEHGQAVEAESALLRLAQVEPRDGAVFFNLGNIYTRMEHWGGAIQSYERSLELRPDWPPTLLALAEAFTKAGNRQRAEELLRRAAQLAPQDPTIRASLERIAGT
jgi:glycosyltransferase involved in cell wall biosynthesis/Flp pilus assembly protein TadD